MPPSLVRAAASVLAIAALASSAAAETIREYEAKTPRGELVRVSAHYPEDALAGKLPALVIAPGQGYHKDLPLIRHLASRAAAAGVVTFRFDWAYQGEEGGAPSPSLSEEVEDLELVVSLALGDERVDPQRIMLAGKSLGSVVAYRVFQAYSKIQALVLLTPVVSWGYDEEGQPTPEPRSRVSETYPDLAKTTRPVVLTLGDADPHCHLPLLYAALSETRGNVRVSVVAGDHSLNLGDYRDPKFSTRNEANVLAAVDLTIHWLRVIQERSAD